MEALPLNSIPSWTTPQWCRLGSVMNRVRSSTSDAQVIQRVIGAINSPNNNPNPNAGAIPFIPDETKGLEFRAGVAIQNKLREEAFNGEAMFAIAFKGFLA